MADPTTERGDAPISFHDVDTPVLKLKTFLRQCSCQKWKLTEKTYFLLSVVAMVLVGFTTDKPLLMVCGHTSDFTFGLALVMITVVLLHMCSTYDRGREMEYLAVVGAVYIVNCILCAMCESDIEKGVTLARLIVVGILFVCWLLPWWLAFHTFMCFTPKKRTTGSIDTFDELMQLMEKPLMCCLVVFITHLVFTIRLSICTVTLAVTSWQLFNTGDLVTLVVCMMFAVGWFLVYLFMRREMIWGAIVAVVLYPVQTGYIFWKLVECLQKYEIMTDDLWVSYYVSTFVVWVIMAFIIVVFSCFDKERTEEEIPKVSYSFVSSESDSSV